MYSSVIAEKGGEPLELSIVMPCLNEAETLGVCIEKTNSYLRDSGVNGEVVIADNGSTDNSREIAEELGARVVVVPEKGYGNALLGGIAAARSKYVIMGDADDSYDFLSLEPFVDKLREGYDLVMGNRFKGGIKPGAMPPLHRYLGNPVLSGIGRLFFKSPVKDFHCGLRGFKKASIDRLGLQAAGMEFASEMVVKATLNGLRITEVPTTLSPDGRSHPPHLRSWRDGWRHLRFLLAFCPRWLFMYPGILMAAIGSAMMLAWIIAGPAQMGRIGFGVSSMLIAALLIVLGVQTACFAVCSKIYSVNAGLVPGNRLTDRFRHMFTLERGVILGGLITLAGLAGMIVSLVIWGKDVFGSLVTGNVMRLSIPSFTVTALGIQTIFASLFISVFDLKHKT